MKWVTIALLAFVGCSADVPTYSEAPAVTMLQSAPSFWIVTTAGTVEIAGSLYSVTMVPCGGTYTVSGIYALRNGEVASIRIPDGMLEIRTTPPTGER